MSAPDETMAEIVAAVELGRGGAQAEARQRLTDLWERVGPDGDPLHRVTLAHFLADLQDDVRRRLGDLSGARRHLARAEASVDELTDDGYGRLVRTGLEHVRGALEAGSTEPLPSPP